MSIRVDLCLIVICVFLQPFYEGGYIPSMDMIVAYMTADGPAEATVLEESDDEQELPAAFTHVYTFHHISTLPWLLCLQRLTLFCNS